MKPRLNACKWQFGRCILNGVRQNDQSINQLQIYIAPYTESESGALCDDDIDTINSIDCSP